MVALCNGTKAHAEAIRDEIREFLRDTLKLELSEEKTVVTHACDGFDFLGFHIQHYPEHNGQKAITLIPLLTRVSTAEGQSPRDDQSKRLQ
jgi:hypothetical protein